MFLAREASSLGYVVVLIAARREEYLRRIFHNAKHNDSGDRAEDRRWSDFVGFLLSKKHIVLIDNEIGRSSRKSPASCSQVETFSCQAAQTTLS
jgi:hypothetical protein